MSELVSDILIELHVPDFAPAKEFYGKIGYEIVWQKEEKIDEGYLVMRNGKSILNFYCGTNQVYKHDFFGKFPKDTPRGYAVEIIIQIAGIESFYKKFKMLFPENIVKELNNKYSHKDFRAVDPYGFYVRFVEKNNWVEGRKKDGTVT